MAHTLYHLGGAVLCLLAWLLGLRICRRLQTPRAAQSCAFCGYLTTGLPSSICPECGQDLNVVGVKQPRSWQVPPHARLFLTLASFTTAYGLALWLSWVPFHEKLQPGTYLFSDTVSWTATPRGESIQFSRATSAHCWPWQREALRAAITSPKAWMIEILEPHTNYCTGAEDLLEPRLVRNTSLPQELRYASSHELPPAMQNSTRSDIDDRFWVDMTSDRYAWSDVETETYEHRRGPYGPAFDHWLATRARRFNAPSLPASLRAAVPAALGAPFLGGGNSTYPGCTPNGQGWGQDWEPDPGWTAGFWTIGSLVCVAFAAVLFRRSVWARARRDARRRETAAA